MPSAIPANEVYLTTDLSKKERRKLFKKDSRAIERARLHNERLNDFIKQVIELHQVQKLDAHQIAEFFLPEPHPINKDASYIKEKEELVDYIKKVIQLKA